MTDIFPHSAVPSLTIVLVELQPKYPFKWIFYLSKNSLYWLPLMDLELYKPSRKKLMCIHADLFLSRKKKQFNCYALYGSMSSKYVWRNYLKKLWCCFGCIFVNLFQMFQTQASRRHCTRNIARPKSAPSLSSCNFYLISPGRRDTFEAIFRNIQSLLSYIYHIIFQLVKIHLMELIIRKENAGLVHAWCVSHASLAPLPTMKQACQFFFLANGLPKSFLKR